ncbi:MAG: AAA family ATPase [Leptolyngbya sp. UWPOB_LEPTO1]|uniref:AAA family ATPase n=1 Tax=Leptolyngbya sp. UWPOB_LEPTO1 TaxID=2815653 RepID=UPI001AC735EC|nr:AAA family ATPase [Leptolyngbya sp. UWPOB_LEPTO1]MBN8559468.1 AAA family ATPase [Leptolyngbya sp. UWPOB_LEPTO1]
MRIEALHLTNFRGFKDFKLEFPKSNALVLIGINGAGKSSILDSINSFLNLFVEHLIHLKPSKPLRFPRLGLDVDDIYDGEDTSTLSSTFSHGSETQTFEIEILQSITHASVYGFLAAIMHRQLREEPTSSLPILAYYPANRLIHSLDSRARSKPKAYDFTQFYAYQNAFANGLIHYEDFLNWFRLEEDLENEIISREDRSYVNPNLKTIRTALETFLSRLNVSEFSNLRVVRERRDSDYSFRSSITGSLEVDKAGVSLKIEQLSEGEKSIIMIVCDIARRLTIANPALDDPKTGHGIVLIDEIDNHLHPQWQRRILPALNTTFPNCQFITTTHSPQVLSNLQPEEIFVLDNGKISNNVSYSYGRDSNSILYEFMGVEKRPEWMRQQLDHAFHLIDEGNTDAAKSAIEELKQFLGQNDPDIVRANTLLQFLYE